MRIGRQDLGSHDALGAFSQRDCVEARCDTCAAGIRTGEVAWLVRVKGNPSGSLTCAACHEPPTGPLPCHEANQNS